MLHFLRVLYWGDPPTLENQDIEKTFGCVALNVPLSTRYNPTELILLGSSQVLYKVYFICLFLKRVLLDIILVTFHSFFKLQLLEFPQL